MPAALEASGLPHGPLTDTAVHLCIDMQQMFAGQTAWHVPWMKRVLPTIARIARAVPSRTIFTRFIPPARAADAQGTWRRYYERWPEFTGEQLAARQLALLPEFLALIPPAEVIDKHFYSPFTEPQLHRSLQDRGVDSIVITGGRQTYAFWQRFWTRSTWATALSSCLTRCAACPLRPMTICCGFLTRDSSSRSRWPHVMLSWTPGQDDAAARSPAGITGTTSGRDRWPPGR